VRGGRGDGRVGGLLLEVLGVSGRTSRG
jgi:hypothetical protein